MAPTWAARARPPLPRLVHRRWPKIITGRADGILTVEQADVEQNVELTDRRQGPAISRAPAASPVARRKVEVCRRTGIRAALGEETVTQQGRIANPACVNYAMPRSADTPRVAVALIGGGDENGPPAPRRWARSASIRQSGHRECDIRCRWHRLRATPFTTEGSERTQRRSWAPLPEPCRSGRQGWASWRQLRWSKRSRPTARTPCPGISGSSMLQPAWWRSLLDRLAEEGPSAEPA